MEIEYGVKILMELFDRNRGKILLNSEYIFVVEVGSRSPGVSSDLRKGKNQDNS